MAKKRANGAGFMALGYLAHQIDGVKKFDHVRMVEQILGYELPPGAVVHHVNEDRADNRNANFVVCPNRAYHNLLHRRMEAYDSCGHADWRRCWVCGQYSSPAHITIYKAGNSSKAEHGDCKYWYRKNKALLCAA